MSKITSILSCLALASSASIAAASAETVILRQLPVSRSSVRYVTPSVRTFSRVVPSTTVRKMVVTPTGSATVIEPATTIRRSAIIAPAAAPVTTTTTTEFTSSQLSTPDFGERLANMAEQISMGSTRGWLSSGEFATLQSEHSRLSALLDSYNAGGLSKGEIDDMERRLTLFNQQIAHEIND